MSDSRPARHHHRPTRPGAAFFEARDAGVDPLALAAAADRAATVLVRGAAAADDAAVTERLVRLADTEGWETLAELWSGAAPESIAGCLWRLYALRSWVHADPLAAARQFDAGRARAPLAEVVAGVAEPPGPDELRRMIDEVLRGIAERDFADVLLRAAAFARVVAAGRAGTSPGAGDQTGNRLEDRVGNRLGDAARMLALSEQLERAGHLELDGELA